MSRARKYFVTPQLLRERVTWLEQRLAALPAAVSSDDLPLEARLAMWSAYRKACEQMMGEIRVKAASAVAASVTPSSRPAFVAMLGVRATATSGPAQACRNWIAAARRKADALEAGPRP